MSSPYAQEPDYMSADDEKRRDADIQTFEYAMWGTIISASQEIGLSDETVACILEQLASEVRLRGL
jgi:hypothetical protein